MAITGRNVCLDTPCLCYHQSVSWEEVVRLTLALNWGAIIVTSSGLQIAVRPSTLRIGACASCLAAEVRICSLKAERVVLLLDFFTHDPKAATVLQPNEILI